jgi:death-on-curing protein
VRYLTLSETLEIHIRIIAQTGGALGILNLGTLEAALAQPQMTLMG